MACRVVSVVNRQCTYGQTVGGATLSYCFIFLNLSVSAFSFKFQTRRNTFQHQRAVQRLQTGYSALMIASRVQKLPCHRKNLKSKDWLQIDGCATLLHTMCNHMMKSIILLSVLQKKEADERCSHNVH